MTRDELFLAAQRAGENGEDWYDWSEKNWSHIAKREGPFDLLGQCRKRFEVGAGLEPSDP